MSIILPKEGEQPNAREIWQGGRLMHPMMRLVLPTIGMLIAASLGSPANRLFDLALGAAVGFLIADLGILRLRVDDLFKELDRLKKEFRRRQDSPTASAPLGSQSATASPTGAQWICARCGEQLESQFTSCWRCGAVRAPKATEYPEYQPVPSAPRSLPDRPWQEIEPSTQDAAPRTSATLQSAAPAPHASANEDKVIAAIRGFFTGGNTLVRVGVIVLFFGVAFLLRYMAEHSHVSIEVRLTGVALASIALIVFGWRLRRTREGYALALQGAGVGILYLIIYAALRLYSILPATIAFPLLALIAILSAVLAILQDSMSFALLGVTGGFLAPVLASTGLGSHVVLFSYYAVLNAGIVTIAWFKSWRPLNIAGFAFTFAIGTVWGVLKYRPEDFATTEPFLILFFLFYLGIAILFTLRQPTKTIGYIDGTIIFGTPIVVFSLQSAMLHDRLMVLAYCAIAMSALYLCVAYLLKRRSSDSHKLLFESFMALSVAFLTLAVPLALDARWNSATWALEGTALIWVGCRQERLLPRLFGALLNFAAACLALSEFTLSGGYLALALGDYFGIVVQSVAAIFSACTLQKYRAHLKELEPLIRDALYWGGLALWLLGSLSELHRYAPKYDLSAALLLVTFTAVGSSEIHHRTQLGVARIAALLQLPAMLGFAAFAAINQPHPFANGGWLGWLPAFASLYFVMFRHEGAARAQLAKYLNSGAAWLFCAIFSWEIAWQVNAHIAGGNTWPTAAWVILPAFVLWRLPKLVTRVKWPFARNREAYLLVGGVGVALYLAAWSLFTDATSAGDSAPLPYVPLLNPLDLGQMLVLLVLLRYWQFLKAVDSPGSPRIDKRVPLPALATLAFIWLNALLLRTLHHWFGIALTIDDLMASTLVQTCLSLFWTVLALTAMLLAARKRERIVWLVGAALLAVVIAKLFLIDLSRIGSVERIISFVGVGLLMLVVGYFSPLPPARESRS
jgi:uncharacterized membrane protein